MCTSPFLVYQAWLCFRDTRHYRANATETTRQNAFLRYRSQRNGCWQPNNYTEVGADDSFSILTSDGFLVTNAILDQTSLVQTFLRNPPVETVCSLGENAPQNMPEQVMPGAATRFATYGPGLSTQMAIARYNTYSCVVLDIVFISLTIIGKKE